MLKNHKKSIFTPEQIETLAANQFTAKVNARQIIFTQEFKNLFLSRYEQGDTSVEIFEPCGYDTEILGRTLICATLPRLGSALGSLLSVALSSVQAQ